jgi:hypothetical protein
MPRIESEKVVRKHLHVYEDDWTWLEATFGESIGISKAVRTIIRKFRQQAEAKGAQTVAKPLDTTVELTEVLDDE